MKTIIPSFRSLVCFLLLGCAWHAVAETYTPMEYIEANGAKYFEAPFKAYGNMTTEARVFLATGPCDQVQVVLAGSGGYWTLGMLKDTGEGYFHLSEKYGNSGKMGKILPLGEWIDVKMVTGSAGVKYFIKSPSDADYGDEPFFAKDYEMTLPGEDESKPMNIFGARSGNNILYKMPAGNKLARIRFWRGCEGADELTEIADYTPCVDEDGFEFLADALTGERVPAQGAKRKRIYVNGDSGDNGRSGLSAVEALKTIDAAIGKFVSADGDNEANFIKLMGDRYPVVFPLTATVTIGSRLILRGVTGRAEDVVLDGQRGGFTPIKFDNFSSARVESLTIRNGYVGNNISGIQFGSGTPVVSNVVVTCCEHGGAAHIGVISMTPGSVLQDSKIVANTNSNAGGIVMLYRGGRVERCVIANNQSTGTGGGVTGYHNSGSYSSSNGMIVDSCVITNNVATYGGGVANVPKVVNCRIENNRATLTTTGGQGGGGVYLQTANVESKYLDLLVTNCVIAANSTTDGGGGINYFNSSVSNLLIDACIITNNTVSSGYRNRGGAGISIWSNPVVAGGVVTIRNSLVADNGFADNQLNSQGSGILANAGNAGGKIRIENCTVTGNRNSGSYKSAINCIGTVELVNVAAIDNFDKDGTAIHGVTSIAAGASKADDGTWAANISYSLLYPAETTWTFAEEQKVKNGEAPRFYKGTYIPRAASPLRDAGAALAWHEGASDLQRAEPVEGEAVGAPIRARVIGKAVDIGCYEYDVCSGLMMLVR